MRQYESQASRWSRGAQIAQIAPDETDPSLPLRIGLDALFAELVRVV